MKREFTEKTKMQATHPTSKIVFERKRKSHWLARNLFFPLVLLAFFGKSAAQTPAKPSHFEQFNTANGLSNNNVQCIFQDRRGFLWVGTANGLNRFDGYQFVHFKNRPGDTTSLSNNFVNAIFEDHDGHIWIGTNGGLNRFDPKTERFRQFRHVPEDSTSLADNQVFSIFETSGGEFWVGAGTGLDKFDGSNEQFSHFKPPTFNPKYPFETRTIAAISEFRGDLVFSAWGTGAWRFDRRHNRFERLSTAGKEPGFQSWVRLFAFDKSGHLLAIDRSLYRFDPERDHFEVFSTQNANGSSFSAMLPSRDGGMVLGSEGAGILFWDGQFSEKWNTLLDPTGNVQNNFVNAILQDSGGEIWVGTLGSGLYKFDPERKQFQVLTKANGLASNHLASVCEMSDGRVFIANRRDGIDVLDPESGKITHLARATNAFFGQHIRTIFQDSKGRVWLGTWGDGLEIWNPTPERRLNFHSENMGSFSPPKDFITSISESPDGKIWVAASEGLSCFDGNALEKGVLQTFNFDQNKPLAGLSDPRPDIVFCDRRGRVWIGTNAGGLNLLDPASGRFQHFRHEQANAHSLSSDKVVCIFEDSRGRIWVGCSGGGLNLYSDDNQHFAHFSEADGLPNDEVQAIVEDGQGMLWLSTGAGISRFDPERKIFKNYFASDGLPQGLFSPQGMAKSRREGRIYAASKEGLLVFHPDSIRDSRFVPPVFFTHFVKYRAEADQNTEESLPGISELGRLELAHGENTFTVGFSALNFRNAAKNRYAYRLLGLNDNWIFSGERREVTFSNLPPGEYTLQVRASNNDGIWNETPRSLEIKIRPPWWKTAWAMLLWAAILAAAVFQFYRFQLKKQLSEAEAERLRELDSLKTRLYTNITHEFRTPLTVIVGNADEVEKLEIRNSKSGIEASGAGASNNFQLPISNSIRRNARNLLQLINQLLDLSKLEHKSLKINYQRGDVVPFLRYVTESFQSYAQGQNLTLRFDSPLEHFEMDYDPPQLQNVLTNLISNALKFTPSGGKISVKLEIGNPKLENGQTSMPPSTSNSQFPMPKPPISNLSISVSDNGIGIGPENLPRIFDRFYQVDDSSTRRAEGTGIGLAYVQELVKLMGGEVSVESELGKGATFKIVLPVRQEGQVFDFDKNQPLKNAGPLPNRQISPPENSSFIPEGIRDFVSLNMHNSSFPQVLVIEDNPDVVNYLKACLSENYNVKVAYNGEAGLALAFEQIPDLIVSDVMMPGKDGFEVCDILKNDERTSHIPFVLLTAKADLASKIAGLRQGADAYLAKPFDREELLATLENLSEIRRKLRARYSSVSEILNLKTPAEPLPDFPLEDEFILKIKSILEENIADEDFGLPELCQKIGMSRSQLFRKMKALVDRAPADFIKTYRLEKARLLLKTGAANVSEAAFSVGFKDLAHFSKSFLEEFGANPSTVKNA